MTTEGPKSGIKRSDLRLSIRAVKAGWALTEVQRTKMRTDALDAILTGSDRLRTTANELLAALAKIVGPSEPTNKPNG